MSSKIAGAYFGFLTLLFIVAGCGSDHGDRGVGEEGAGAGSERHSEVEVVFCPRRGGDVKYLKFDSLEMVDSELEIPVETIYLGSAPSHSFFTALTSEAVYMMPTAAGTQTRSVSIPAISGDVRVVPTDNGLIVLDRVARRLIGINLREDSIEFERSLNQQAEELYYIAEQDKIILVMKKGTSGVLSVLSPEGGESMTINLDEIVSSTVVEEEGRVYLVTRGFEGRVRLESFRISDLSRIFDIDLEEAPGSLIHAPGSNKIYAYHPRSGIVRAIHFDNGETLSEIPLDDHGDATLYTDEVGRYLYLLHEENGLLTIVSTETDLVVGEIENQDGDTKLVTTPDSRYILLQDKGGTRVRLYDGKEFNLLRVFMEDDPMAIGMIRRTSEPSIDEEIQLVEKESGSPGTEDTPKSPPSLDPVEISESHELQVFASNEMSSSRRVINDLLAMGLPAIIDEAVVESGETWYRVKIGTFSSKEDAEAVGGYLKMVRGLEFWAKSVDKERGFPGDHRIEESLQSQDMDSDGFPEIAIVERDGAVQVFSYRSNQFVSRWRVTLPGDQALCGVISYSDMNQDGMPEALLPLCPLAGDYMIAWDGNQFTGDS